MTQAFRKTIVELYNPDETDLKFALSVNIAIKKHFDELPDSKSKLDPERLGSKAVFYAKLRNELLEKAGGFEIDGHPEFNKLSTSEQLRFQMQSRENNTNAWVRDLEILPPIVNAIHMDDREVTKLKGLRNVVDTAKLRKDVVDVDADAIINLLIPTLSNLANAKLMAIVSALLLSTGRRTTEILKTANFYLAPNGNAEGYSCMFSGQLKEGLHETKPYLIPLLAPYYLVKNALDLIRKDVDTTKMTPVDCNERFGKPMNNYLNTIANGMNPHALRAIYALTTFEMLPDNARPTIIGFVSKVLGHVATGNAAFYTRLRIVNFMGPYIPPAIEVAPVAAVPVANAAAPVADIDDNWVITTAPERKRVASMKEMMIRRKRITASSVRTYAGGSMDVISRVIAANKERIDAYNASLL